MEKCMNYDRALDFLLYSYFEFDGGIDCIQSGDDMKMCCARRAYRDLARTVEYKYSTSMLENMNKKNSTQKDKNEAKAFQDNKSKLINGVCSSILEKIDKITKKMERDTFETWHKNVCSDIIKLMKAEKSDIYKGIIKDFTYGQAQKWLNMTLKYLWLLNLLPDGLDEKLLYIPVDSYIIDKLWNDENIVFPLKENVNRKYNYTTPSDYVVSWSNWTEKNYDKFREKLDEKYNLEWEAKTWIEQAKIRKENENKTKIDPLFKENNPL